MKKLVLFMIICFLVSCGISKPQVQENTYKSTTIKEELKDTLVSISGDKSHAVYEFKILKDTLHITDTIVKNRGRYLDAPAIVIKNNKLIVSAQAPEQKVRVLYKYIYRIDTVQTVKTTYITTNKLNGWQNFNYWTGMIWWGLVVLSLILYTLLFILRKKRIT